MPSCLVTEFAHHIDCQIFYHFSVICFWNLVILYSPTVIGKLKDSQFFFCSVAPSSAEWKDWVFMRQHKHFAYLKNRNESWTIKKAECWRIDVSELWCWRRLLRVPWTARRSNQSILKETTPEYSLEGLMLKLKLQSLTTWCETPTHWQRPWC